MQSGSWPHRFRVTIHTNGGASVDYSAVTLLSPEKAVAMAVAAHLRGHDQAQVATRVHDVEIDDLGPVERARDGTAAVGGDDLVDRVEW